MRSHRRPKVVSSLSPPKCALVLILQTPFIDSALPTNEGRMRLPQFWLIVRSFVLIFVYNRFISLFNNSTHEEIHMNLPSKTMVKRLAAVALCLLALNVYVAFAPTPVLAAACGCSNCGECNNGQRCVCFYEGTVCKSGVWNDDVGCKCKTGC